MIKNEKAFYYIYYLERLIHLHMPYDDLHMLITYEFVSLA